METKREGIRKMNPIKKFVYYTLQLLTVFPLLYYALRYRCPGPMDAYYNRASDWFDRFKEEENRKMTLEIKSLFCKFCKRYTLHNVNTDLGFISQCQVCRELN